MDAPVETGRNPRNALLTHRAACTVPHERRSTPYGEVAAVGVSIIRLPHPCEPLTKHPER